MMMNAPDAMMLTWSNMLRSRVRTSYQQVMEVGGVVFDAPRRRLLVDGHVVQLPAREATVLGVLMARPGRVVYRPALAEAAWGTHRARHRAADRLLRRLRRRLEPSPLSPVRLRRVGGTGYTFGSTPNRGSS